METMHTAPLQVFAHNIAGHFQCCVGTDCDSPGPQHQKREGTEMERNRPELEVNLESNFNAKPWSRMSKFRRINLPLLVKFPLIHLFLQGFLSTLPLMCTPLLARGGVEVE